MYKTKTILLVFIMTLSITASYAQIKNKKIEVVKIFGNCGMCESTIEKAGNLKRVANVDWNKETKLATVEYDSTKTDKNEILKKIALAGYDSEVFFAPDDTYAALPGCCQYERSKKENSSTATSEKANLHDHSAMKMEKDKLMMTEKEQVMSAEKEPLQNIYNSYFELKNALVGTDGGLASLEAKKLVEAISQIKMENLSAEEHMVWMKVKKDMLIDAQRIEETKDATLQREYFISLSENIYQLIKVSKIDFPIYYQHCPMANNGKGANWLSKENTIKNPYFGMQMLSCGNTVETIKN